MLQEAWRITLLGELQARQGGRVVSRFATQKTGALLAYLAYYADRAHTREELTEQLWPDTGEAGRNSLRVALASLRRILEPASVTPGTVIVADRSTASLRPGAFATDTAEFARHIEHANRAQDEAERAAHLIQAVALYRSGLLPNLYDAWAEAERVRLAEVYLNALRRLVRSLAAQKQYEQSLPYARLAVSLDPLREEAHIDAMRLYAAAGQPTAALRQYQELERVLRADMNALPSAASRALAAQITNLLGHGGGHAPSVSDLLALSPADAPSPDAPLPNGTPRNGLGNASPRPAPTWADSSGAAGSPSPRDAASPAYSLPQDTPRSRGSLPLPLTSFFGREAEIAGITAQLSPAFPTAPPSAALIVPPPSSASPADTALAHFGGVDLVSPQSMPISRRSARLVTLTGPGGTGKTRLAVEAGQGLEALYPGGVWFVPLADVAAPSLIVAAVAGVLRLPRTQDADPIEQIVAFAARAPLLLILDNFEHLALSGGEIVAALLEHAPLLACLVTSRRTLGVAGEQEIAVAPLPLPPSVQLFLDRAQAARPDFQITASNKEAVYALCRGLEGLPLALELAAARIRAMTPAQMLAHLSQRFDLLVNRRAGKDARHRSLRATLEWSVQMLSPTARRFFARLSVFAGGWTLEAAQDICDAPDALELLEQLRDDSLLIAEAAGEGGEQAVRFRFLETVREFARELRRDADDMEERHAVYFLRLITEAEPQLRGPNAKTWLARLAAEQENLRAVQAWSLTPDADQELGLHFANLLWLYWTMRGSGNEARQWLDLLFARAGEEHAEPTLLRAKAINTAGMMAHRQSDFGGADRYYSASITMFRALDNRRGLFSVLSNLGGVARDQGDLARARMLLEESLTIAREEARPFGVAAALNNLASVVTRQQEFDLARRLLEECLPIKRALQEPTGIAITLCNLAVVAHEQGDYAQANQLEREGLAICRNVGDKEHTLSALSCLGDTLQAQGDRTAARACYEECLHLSQETGSRTGAALSLGGMASVAQAVGLTARAASLLAASETLRHSIGYADTLSNTERHKETLAAARAALPPDAFAAAWETGRSLTLDQAITLALQI